MRLIICLTLICGLVAAVPSMPIMIPEDSTVIEHTNDSEINNTLWCPICEFLVREGEDFITKNTSVEHASAFLSNACHHLPKEKQDECETFVKDNYNKLVELIISKESPPIVCSQLHVCNETEYTEHDECNFCKFIAHRIEVFLHKNNTLTNIIEYGEKLCGTLAKKHQEHCNNIIVIYYHEIVGKLVDRHNFVDTCESMHFCHSGDLTEPMINAITGMEDDYEHNFIDEEHNGDPDHHEIENHDYGKEEDNHVHDEQ